MHRSSSTRIKRGSRFISALYGDGIRSSCKPLSVSTSPRPRFPGAASLPWFERCHGRTDVSRHDDEIAACAPRYVSGSCALCNMSSVRESQEIMESKRLLGSIDDQTIAGPNESLRYHRPQDGEPQHDDYSSSFCFCACSRRCSARNAAGKLCGKLNGKEVN